MTYTKKCKNCSHMVHSTQDLCTTCKPLSTQELKKVIKTIDVTKHDTDYPDYFNGWNSALVETKEKLESEGKVE